MTPDDAAGELFDTWALLKSLDARVRALAGEELFDEDAALEVARVLRVANERVYHVACKMADFKHYFGGLQ